MTWAGPFDYTIGLSAQAIAYRGHKDHPHDPSDLVRCISYCHANGITTDALRKRMAGRTPEWSRLVAAWDDLVALLRHEIDTRTDDMAPRTYREMKRVLADGIACAACGGTGRGEECVKCKGTGRRCGGRCRAQRCYGGADFCPACRGRGFTEKESAA